MDDDQIPSFPPLDEEEELEEEPGEAAEGRNRGFLFGVIALAAILVLGICAAVLFFFYGRQLLGGQAAGPSPNELTNNFNMTQFAITQTSGFMTQSAPTQTPLPTTPPPPRTSPTPTSGVAVTVIGEGTTEGTQIAEITPGTPGTGTPAATPGTGTPRAGTPGAATPTRAVSGLVTPTPIQPTSSIIEVTPIGGGPTPTRIVSGVGGTVTARPTGAGGPVQPTVQPTLPVTGFTGGAGLLGAGFLAVVLIAVVVVVRRMRLK